MKNFLLDDWSSSGTTMEEFKELVKRVAESTKFIKCNSKELTVLSFDYLDEEKGHYVFNAFNPLTVPSETKKAPNSKLSLQLDVLLEHGDFEDLIDEVVNKVGVVFYNGVRCFFVSKKVITQRLQPFGLNGDFLGEKSYERDLLIAKQFGKKALFRTLVVREYDGRKKVFSMLSERYKQVSQDILIEIFETLTKNGLMGKVECSYWELDHFSSYVKIEFPEKAEEFQTTYGLPKPIIPGILLETSDTGDCALRVIGTWRTSKSVSHHSEVSKRHSGGQSVESLLEEVNNEIFAEYTKMPEALCELMAQNITDPAWDLTSHKDQAKNKKMIERVLKNAFKKLGIVGAIGKHSEVALYQQLCYEFDPAIAYTAYDIATSIMTMPERVEGLHKLFKDKLAKAVGKAPYIKYETNQPSDDVILTV